MKYLIALFLLLSAGLRAEEDFDALMGKGTPHWNNLQSAADVALLDRFKALYEKNRALETASSSISKIPRVVHFIWLGLRPFPAESVENVRNWMAKNPDWTFKFWTDRDRPPPCRGMERKLVQEFQFLKLGNYFKESQNYGEQSDLLRYEILFQEGGVYCDHDANCLRPFETLHGNYDLYCGLEAPHPPIAGQCITAGIGVIGSRAGHPVIEKVIAAIDAKWDMIGRRFRGRDGYSKTERVLQRTYIALTEVLEEAIDKEGNVDIVLPAAYFFAKGGIPSLYSKHFYGNTWADSEKKNTDLERKVDSLMSQLLRKEKRAYWLVAAMAFINIAGLVIGFYYLKRRKPGTGTGTNTGATIK